MDILGVIDEVLGQQLPDVDQRIDQHLDDSRCPVCGDMHDLDDMDVCGARPRDDRPIPLHGCGHFHDPDGGPCPEIPCGSYLCCIGS